MRSYNSYAGAEKAAVDQLVTQAQEPLRLPSVDEIASLALQLDARLNDDPQAGRAQLLRWLKDGKLRVVLGPDGKPYAKGELIPFTVLAEAENTKPAEQLGGFGAHRYMSFVAGARCFRSPPCPCPSGSRRSVERRSGATTPRWNAANP